jgi:DNA-binding NtrC family response regulator
VSTTDPVARGDQPVVLVLDDMRENFDLLLHHVRSQDGGRLAREFQFEYLDCYAALQSWYQLNRSRFVAMLVIDVDFSHTTEPRKLLGFPDVHHPVPKGFDPTAFQGFLLYAGLRHDNIDRIAPVLFVAGTRQLASAQRFSEFVMAPGQGACAFVDEASGGRFNCPAIAERLDALALRPLGEAGRRDWRDRHDMVIGHARPMVALAHEIARIGRSETTVLLLGKPGVGKELVANAIHRLSRRHAAGSRDLPNTVNIGALDGTLLEDELFGHVRGAFTGAVADRKGIFEAGQNSTVFLDEIGDIAHETQLKLLRCMENRTIKRLGDSHEVGVDIRIVAATNRAIEYLQTNLRPDFYSRLVQHCLVVPSLRERFAGEDPYVLEADLAEFAEFLIEKLNRSPMNPRKLRLDIGAIRFLVQLVGEHVAATSDSFDGNARTLRNLVERSYERAQYDGSPAVSVGHVISTMGVVQFTGRQATLKAAATLEQTAGTLNLERIERQAISEALRKCGSNHSQAAELLGIHRDTLRRKLANIDKEQHNSA